MGVKVDVHSHCVPPSFLEWLRKNGPEAGVGFQGDGRLLLPGGFSAGPPVAELSDLPARLRAMDRIGIDHQVMSGWIDLTAYELEPEAGAEYSRAHNRCLAEEAARRPDRLSALATVPLQDPVSAAETLREAMGELGMKGAQIATSVAGRRLDRAGLEPFWSVAGELGAVIFLHPLRPLAGVDMEGFFLENAVGRPAETTIAAAFLIMSGAAERHPGISFILAHGGGFLPYQIGRLNRACAVRPDTAAARISQPPGHYLRRMYADAVVHHPAALSFLAETLGSDRILLGTDYPFAMGEPDPAGAVRAAARLGEEDRRAILGGNAARLLGLGGPSPVRQS